MWLFLDKCVWLKDELQLWGGDYKNTEYINIIKYIDFRATKSL